jgi:multiple sugar transport system ATP-binding protein
MDEPLSNLDSKMRVHMRAELVRLHRELAGTIIYVTHDQVEAMTMGQRLAVIDGGELQQVGTPQEVYDQPHNLFVASFLGSPSMNLLDGRAARENGTVGIRTAAAFITLPASLARAVEASGSHEFIVGLRPEALALAENDEGNAAVLEGTVDLVEALGNEQHVLVALQEGTVTVRTPSISGLQVGSRVRLGAQARGLHIFDAVTQERIG